MGTPDQAMSLMTERVVSSKGTQLPAHLLEVPLASHRVPNSLMNNNQKNLLLQKSSLKVEKYQNKLALLRQLRQSSNNSVQVYPHIVPAAYSLNNLSGSFD